MRKCGEEILFGGESLQQSLLKVPLEVERELGEQHRLAQREISAQQNGRKTSHIGRRSCTMHSISRGAAKSDLISLAVLRRWARIDIILSGFLSISVWIACSACFCSARWVERACFRTL
jgi:hypothetical protein